MYLVTIFRQKAEKNSRRSASEFITKMQRKYRLKCGKSNGRSAENTAAEVQQNLP